jgi:vitamin B12 transporter
MKYFFLSVCLLLGLSLEAQHLLSGTVKDNNSLPLAGANVFIKGTYDGSITDTLGRFSLKYTSNDSSVVMVSYIGYQSYEASMAKIAKIIPLEIILEEKTNAIEEVVITAGTFQASEKNRAVLLNPIEIATTASSDGDVYGALKMFPGVQKQGETGKIIVRGGDISESKTFMDGLLVSSPYTSSMPDLPARGRFSPFMFNGVMFSTGGYSAEYGQALSSVLELQTPGLFEEDITSISLINVGVGLSHTKRYAHSAYSAEANYNNLYPYFLMAKHELNWIEVPESYGGNFYHRLKIGNSGMLKTDLTYSHSHSVLDYSNFNTLYKTVGLTNNNLFVKTNYYTDISKKWLLKFGVAYNNNKDEKNLESDKLNEKLGSLHARLGLTNYINDKTTVKIGVETFYLDSHFNFYADSSAFTYQLSSSDLLTAAYIETDIKLTKKTAIRIGGRGEYSSETQNSDIAPRFSIAQKLSKTSQLSFAYGKYYQQPETEYLYYSTHLDFENASHYIVNYQYNKGNRFFRSEVYYKIYDKLITYHPVNTGQYEKLSNSGDGYAKGIDIFWKDNQTLRYVDYWISYSYIDSKRKYKDYQSVATPEFVSAHNFSFVLKYWIQKINTQACLTYNFTSGRPYNNPNNSHFMNERTQSFNDLSANLSYITNIFGYFTVVHFSVSNILGIKNIYSYNYSKIPDENGVYAENPVSSMVQRTFILGVFISIK